MMVILRAVAGGQTVMMIRITAGLRSILVYPRERTRHNVLVTLTMTATVLSIVRSRTAPFNLCASLPQHHAPPGAGPGVLRLEKISMRIRVNVFPTVQSLLI